MSPVPVTPSPNSGTSIPVSVLTKLGEIESGFVIDDALLEKILAKLIEDFALGLSKYGEPMAMIPTYVTGVPTGKETGTFLALDLGGTNLRVCEVKLDGNHGFQLRQQKYKVSEALKTGDARALFDYMADSVDSFLTQLGPTGDDIDSYHLGFTFSFPVEQTALDSGTLLTWTKGFSAKNAQGNDVVKMLQDALDRKHLHVKCTALVNDTVGTMLSRAYGAGDCLVGCIFGTGTNAAYVDDIETLGKLPDELRLRGGKMIANTEWGAFDNARTVLPFTQFDNKVDRESINPRFQAFEKFISGMYQGEVTRNLLLYLIDNNIILKGYSTPQLNSHYGFDTALMSELETEEPRTPEFYTRARKVFTDIGFKDAQVSDIDCDIARWACEVVATRAARLSAVGIAAVVKKTKAAEKMTGDIQVGVDGSVVEHYPHFEERVRIALKAMLGPEIESRIKIGMAKDGSGVGGMFHIFCSGSGTVSSKVLNS
ncbi:hypothetical protein DL93DRAFT_2059334 [Clavulina sp. PMI_390]|nr:hypothetical protein DL93DRAFT_2059334 [Clavulina sp. PMI_390]